MPSVSIHTLGCKLNYAESGTLGQTFQKHEFSIVPFGSVSDVTVINTCTVTEEAERKCRQTIRKVLRANPDTFLLVTGCYAQLRPHEIASIPGVDAVLGSHEKLSLFETVRSFTKREQTQVSVSCIDEIEDFGPAYAAGERTRAFLKIQDGCDYVCSFCTIPLARGKSRSASIEGIMGQAKEIGEAGYREIVISGVNIGLFGQDSGESLLQLLQDLDSVVSIDRYRISSIEPNLLTDDIIDFVSSSDRFMPHFHIPLQSGDDEILGKMRRRYRSDRYRDRAMRIKSAMPHACIGCDVIVGFPGETPKHFQATYDFISSLPVSYLHVFTYSERPETRAVDESGDLIGHRVPKGERSKRNQTLRLLSERKRASFYAEHVGTKRTVLWEQQTSDAQRVGFTDNYIRVEQNEIGEATEASETALVFLDSITKRGTVRAREPEFIPLI